MLKSNKLAIGFFAIFFIQGMFLIQSTSPTTDEVPFHMVNGYAYLKTHDYRMSPANPPLLRQWMALPWLLKNPKLDLETKAWQEAESIPFGVNFFYKDNRAIADWLLYASRFMNLLLGLAFLFVVFRWSSQVYGREGGLISLAFFSFSPNLLAYSSIAHTDLGISLFLTLAAFYLWRYLEHSKKSDFFKFFIAFGLACASKYNALFFAPIFLVIIAWKKGWGAFLKAIIYMPAISFFIIWMSYGFEFKALLSGGVPRVQEKLEAIAAICRHFAPGKESVVDFFQNAALTVSIPIPSYILGIAGIVRSHREPYNHFTFGEWTTDAQWYYYFFSFLVKVTIPFLMALVLRAYFFRKCSAASRHENTVILGSAGALFLGTCFDSTAVGIRYLLPVMGMLFVWIGGLGQLFRDSKAWRWTISTLILLHAVAALSVFPHYLSYFNQAVGGVRGGYKYVRGSDVDWGQGLKGLKSYMTQNGAEEITLEYFGSADPSFYGIKNHPFSDAEKIKPQEKLYAVSLFYFEHVAWAKDIEPTALVGGSIFVYDLRKDR